MEDNYKNLVPSMGLTNLVKEIRGWFYEQRLWTDMMVKKNPDDPVWRHVSYINAQLDGLYAGYKSVQKNNQVTTELNLDIFFVSLLF